MNRIDRLFAIQTFLQSRKYASAESIAEKFSISVRTVYRDVKALCESGIPISFEPAKGYCIMRGYFLPPVSFTTEEAAALMLMEGATRIFADRGIQKPYATALDKIKAVLHASQKDGIELLRTNTAMQIPACMEVDFDHLATLQNSISKRHILEIDYKTKEGEQSRRQVEPVGLLFYAMGWHLMAWCHKRGAYRDFRVSRMVRVYNTGLPFEKAEHLSLEALTTDLLVAY